MFSYRLRAKRFTQHWSLNDTLALREALGIESSGPDTPIGEALAERADVKTIPEPLTLSVDGSKRSSLLVRARGFAPTSTCDLIVDDELLELLDGFKLPEHERLHCVARQTRFTWLWWTETFESQLDAARCKLEVRESSGETKELVVEELDDYLDASRDAVNRMADVLIRSFAWASANVETLDLVPFSRTELLLSERLGTALQSSGLPGFEVIG